MADFIEPSFEYISRATIAIHAVDCDVVACSELMTNGRYAMWGYAAAFALANPHATNLAIRTAAREWRSKEAAKERHPSG